MAEFTFTAGGRFETLTKPELSDALAAQYDLQQRTQLAGVKEFRFPVLQGTAVGGVLNIGGDVLLGAVNPAWSGRQIGPTQGFTWTVLRLAIFGLTAGVTPDVVNLIRYGGGPDPVWQFNGNNFAYTFTRGSLDLQGGESFQLVSVGAFAATGNIRLTGQGILTPTEMVGKILI